MNGKIIAMSKRMAAIFAVISLVALGVFALLPSAAFATDDTSDLTSATVDMGQFAAADAELTAQDQDSTPVDMYRMYNPNSGEHFYTADASERSFLIQEGWHYEGIGWRAPKSSSEPVYRLYNANAGDHHYTLNAQERDDLVNVGWKYEKIGWYSDEAKSVSLLRQYNPNAKAGSHNFTTDQKENDHLVSVGWRAEGIGWYAVGEGAGAEDFSCIYLDAGHGIGSSYPGQYDSGAVGNGYREADLTAELVEMTAKYASELYGLTVYTNVGTGVQYYNRQADAKKRGCTSLVSIHFNAGGGTGSESYIHPTSAGPCSDKLQSIMHSHLLAGMKLTDRGAKSMRLSVCDASKTKLPAVLLEVAFIDSASDMSKYQSRKDKVARELAAGLYEAAKAGF